MSAFVNGILVGVGLGALFAPAKGEETRRRLTSYVIHLWQQFSSQGQLTPETGGSVAPPQIHDTAMPDNESTHESSIEKNTLLEDAKRTSGSGDVVGSQLGVAFFQGTGPSEM